MTKFSLLHISDLHLTSKHAWDLSDILTKSEVVFREMKGNGLIPDYIAITGDLADTGNKREYEYCEQFFESTIKSIFMCRNDSFLFVPGNHDVDRSCVSNGAVGLQDQVLEHGNQEHVASVLVDDTDRYTLLRRHDAYLSFVNRFLGTNQTEPWWGKKHSLKSGHTIGIVGLCSSWMSHQRQDKGRLAVGKFQVASVRDALEDCDLRIALVHHPLDYLADFDSQEMTQFFNNDVDVVLRGHMHAPTTTAHVSSNDTFIDIDAGAFYSGSSFPNTFKFLQFDLENWELNVHHFTWHNGKWIIDRNAVLNRTDGVDRLKLAKSLRRVNSVSSTIEPPDRLYSDTSNVDKENFGFDIFDTVLNAPPEISAALATLSSVPKYPLELGKHFLAVRQIARSLCETSLLTSRLVWLEIDWDLGRNSFIGSVLESLGLHSPAHSLFHLNGDCAPCIDQLFDEIQLQFGMSLQTFCRNAQSLPKSVLVIENLSQGVFAQDQPKRASFENVCRILLDYCPNLHLILVSRFPPPDSISINS